MKGEELNERRSRWKRRRKRKENNRRKQAAINMLLKKKKNDELKKYRKGQNIRNKNKYFKVAIVPVPMIIVRYLTA